MNKIFLTIVIAYFFFFSVSTVEAKTLPQAAKAKKVSVSKTSSGTSIGVSPRLRADKKAVIVYFSNLKNAKSVAYQLTYKQVSSSGGKTSSQDEGAMGGINIAGKSNTSQEILFGTCSKNVCRYHAGVNDVRLEVSYTSVNGKKYLKKYKIKV